MSKEIRCTVDDDLYSEVETWNRHRHGKGAKITKYVDLALRQLVRRDRAAWEKNHAFGSSPEAGE